MIQNNFDGLNSYNTVYVETLLINVQYRYIKKSYVFFHQFPKKECDKFPTGML